MSLQSRSKSHPRRARQTRESSGYGQSISTLPRARSGFSTALEAGVQSPRREKHYSDPHLLRRLSENTFLTLF
jgi:hypothetical protein